MTVRRAWIEWRNRLLASPRFQDWALSTPIVRRIARRRAQALFDLVAGFAYSQALAAAVRLDLPALLAEGPQNPDALAGRLGLPPDSAAVLLRAAAALGLAERLEDGGYMLGPQGAALRGTPGVAAMIAHHDLLYADLADPVAVLARGGGGGKLADFWLYGAGGDPAAVADYSRLMAASQPLVAQQILDAWDFGRHRSVLDVGGGEGAFLAALAARHPTLRLALFDLPAVAGRARARLGTSATVHGGDFRTDPLPLGADLVTLVRILHDHDDGPAQALLDRIARALPPGGTLLVAEPFAATPGAEAMGAYFGLYLLAMGSGRPRAAGEIGAMLERAGFAHWRQRRTRHPLTLGMIVATR